MKKLFIVRHGKSSWDYGGIRDEDRPLAQRGIGDAYLMADQLKSRGCEPDLLIASTATRALSTAVIFGKVLKVSPSNMVLEPALYMSYEEEILDVVKDVSNEVNTLMIFGHNPSFTDFSNIFTSSIIDNIPTAGVVELDFDIEDWKEINRGKVKKELFDYPKKYK